LANAELSAYGVQANGHPIDAVYSPFTNPYIDAMLLRKRVHLKCGLITKENAVRQLMKSLKRGRSVGLHVDVRVEGGEAYPFFGKDAPTTTAPAWLALKTHCNIVPVRTERLRDAHFRVTLYPSIPAAVAENETFDQALKRITLEINRVMETFVRKTPGQWICTKRRWPRD
jgi:KDO2-lipid IV(A) lauroyltransferase